VKRCIGRVMADGNWFQVYKVKIFTVVAKEK